jgi:hypothetical protein
MQEPGTGVRWGRRRVLAAAGAAGAVLVGCGPAAATTPSSSVAAPTAGSGRVLLLWRPWYGATSQTLPLMYQGTQPFRDKHPSIDVKPVLSPQLGGMVPGMLAGNGPDVFQDWVLPPYINSGQALDLQPYITKDNVDLGVFSSSEMEFFKEVSGFSSTGTGLYFLPCYIHTQTIVVNLSVLDAGGFSYPDDSGMPWSAWAEAFQKWTQRSSDPQKAVLGGAADWEGYNDSSYNFVSPYYLAGFGGGYVDPADPTRSILGTSATVNFARQYVQLVREGSLGFPSMQDFTTGRAASAIRGSGSGLVEAALQWKGLKWRFFPPPVFPTRRTAYSATDAYGIWSGTKHPDAAWSFFKWLTVEPEWAQFMIKLQLRGPAQLSLWNTWVAEVTAVAPPLANTNLAALAAGPLNNWTYPGHLFRYDDAGVRAILGQMSTQVMQHGADPAVALPQAAQQIDALQSEGAIGARQAQTLQKAFPATGSPVAPAVPGV